MTRFDLVFGNQRTAIVARTPRGALDVRAARTAPVGARLEDGAGSVLATHERIALVHGWINAWLPTPAWRDDDAPMGVEELRAELEGDGPVLQLVAGGR